MQLDLAGKAVLVTGSSRGIGRVIAESFLAEGCRVAVNSRTADELYQCARAIGASIAVVGDVTDVMEARRIVDETIHSLGCIDILVCNVGNGRSVPPGQETYEEWQRMFAFNLWSTTNTVEAARNALVSSRGVIVCVSSICGLEIIPGAPITYSSAKAALNSYIRGISRPLGRHGVRINGIAPGNILFDDSVWSLKLAEDPDAVQNMLERDVALARFGSGRDVAALVAYLASPRAGFATGGIWTLDGGQVHS